MRVHILNAVTKQIELIYNVCYIEHSDNNEMVYFFDSCSNVIGFSEDHNIISISLDYDLLLKQIEIEGRHMKNY